MLKMKKFSEKPFAFLKVFSCSLPVTGNWPQLVPVHVTSPYAITWKLLFPTVVCLIVLIRQNADNIVKFVSSLYKCWFISADSDLLDQREFWGILFDPQFYYYFRLAETIFPVVIKNSFIAEIYKTDWSGKCSRNFLEVKNSEFFKFYISLLSW